MFKRILILILLIFLASSVYVYALVYGNKTSNDASVHDIPVDKDKKFDENNIKVAIPDMPGQPLQDSDEANISKQAPDSEKNLESQEAVSPKESSNGDQAQGIPTSSEQNWLTKVFAKEDADDDDSDNSVVSVDLSDQYDISWTSAMDAEEYVYRPNPLVLPFLQSYPIENIEVKFKLLNKKF